ncbi:hypothetical protein [Okeania sp. KiyG1]|uniref:hypothetical protein n=1 Tax=Okeania sp. KiyG1 TaxID=2720165 RepID=UPI0019222E13|nr:hypothetical protein [Okeania sp. KiyG1]
MKHLNREVAIAKFFTPSARTGFSRGYTNELSASCEAQKKSTRISPFPSPKNYDSILSLGTTRPYA